MVNNKIKKARKDLLKDFVLIFIGAFVALFLSSSGILDNILGLFSNTAVASFFSGIFFTSVFTLAPASVAFGHLALSGDLVTIAFWGALGAMCGDLILFFFIRDRFTEDLTKSLRPSLAKHILHSFHLGFMKWLSPILGAFIIASPLPDELGLTLMGISKMRIAILLPISFVMNALGIYFIVWLSSIF